MASDFPLSTPLVIVVVSFICTGSIRPAADLLKKMEGGKDDIDSKHFLPPLHNIFRAALVMQMPTLAQFMYQCLWESVCKGDDSTRVVLNRVQLVFADTLVDLNFYLTNGEPSPAVRCIRNLTDSMFGGKLYNAIDMETAFRYGSSTRQLLLGQPIDVFSDVILCALKGPTRFTVYAAQFFSWWLQHMMTDLVFIAHRGSSRPERWVGVLYDHIPPEGWVDLLYDSINKCIECIAEAIQDINIPPAVYSDVFNVEGYNILDEFLYNMRTYADLGRCSDSITKLTSAKDKLHDYMMRSEGICDTLIGWDNTYHMQRPDHRLGMILNCELPIVGSGSTYQSDQSDVLTLNVHIPTTMYRDSRGDIVMITFPKGNVCIADQTIATSLVHVEFAENAPLDCLYAYARESNDSGDSGFTSRVFLHTSNQVDPVWSVTFTSPPHGLQAYSKMLVDHNGYPIVALNNSWDGWVEDTSMPFDDAIMSVSEASAKDSLFMEISGAGATLQLCAWDANGGANERYIDMELTGVCRLRKGTACLLSVGVCGLGVLGICNSVGRSGGVGHNSRAVYVGYSPSAGQSSRSDIVFQASQDIIGIKVRHFNSVFHV